MLILYFKIAGSTPVDLGKPVTDPTAKIPVPPDPLALANSTVRLIFYIFVLYLAWDGLGILMARSKDASGQFRYPAVENKQPVPATQQPPDWAALIITSVFFVLFAFLWPLLNHDSPLQPPPNTAFSLSIIFLLAYRLAKETKTSWLKRETNA